MKIARVAEIAEQIRGVTFSKGDSVDEPRSGFLPVLTASNITETGLKLDSVLYIPEAKISSRQRLQKNDVLITASSGSLSVVGRAVLVRDSLDAGFGAFCKVLRPGPEIDPNYFAHFFRTPSYRAEVSRLAAGANINNLRNEDLDGFRIPLPPLPEQRRIADILDRADDLRAQRRRTIFELNRASSSSLIGMLSAFRISGEHDLTTLGELILSFQNGLYRPSTDYGSGTPILRIGDFDGGGILSFDGLRGVRVPPSDVDRFGLAPFDVVINRVNALSHVGKSALVGVVEQPTVFESNMMRVRFNSEVVHPQFVVAWLQTEEARNQIRASAKQAINQASINQRDVAALKLVLPPIREQRSLVAQLDEFSALSTKLRTHLAKLDELFASLQHRAFQGEL